jgi:pectinesterase
MIRRAGRAFVATGLLVTVCAVSPPAFAADNRLMVNINSGACMAVPGSSTQQGASLIQWSCNQVNLDQQWQLSTVSTNVLNLINANSGQCLAVPGSSTTRGVSLIQWPCNAANHDQQWTVTTTDPNSFTTLVNVNSGQCLAVPGASSTDGTSLIQWTCNNSSEQNWRLCPPSSRLIPHHLTGAAARRTTPTHG